METRIQSLSQENPTCRRATKPEHHNYWACALELGSCNYWTQVPQLLKPAGLSACPLQQEKPPKWDACVLQLESSPHLLQLEKSLCSTKDSAQPKNKWINKIILKKEIVYMSKIRCWLSLNYPSNIVFPFHSKMKLPHITIPKNNNFKSYLCHLIAMWFEAK